jgi:HAMP domain-containing protein
VLALVRAPGLWFQRRTALPAGVGAAAGGAGGRRLAVQVANREYQERALAREGLRRMYIGTLTLALFLAVFGAVLLAVLLGNQLVRPLLVLAEGMREVAAGNLAPKPAMTSRDELAGLTRTFAHMTQDLADARRRCSAAWPQVDAARDNLQTILDNLTAGVVVLDEQGRAQRQPRRARMLRTPLARCTWDSPCRGAGAGGLCGQGVQQQFERFLSDQNPTRAATGSSRSSSAPRAHGPFDQGITLIARGACCPTTTACWCSTTCPKWSRPSAPRPGARWRAGWPTKSRTRSRPSSCRPSAWP